MKNRSIDHPKIINKEEYAKLMLIQATFKIAIDERKNVINTYADVFIEEMEKDGKEYLVFKGDIERVNSTIKKLKKAIKSMEKLSRHFEFIPLRGFK